jgi:hypothetical protein
MFLLSHGVDIEAENAPCFAFVICFDRHMFMNRIVTRRLMNDRYLSKPRIGASHRAAAAALRLFLFLGSLIVLTTAGSCNSETLFKSEFATTPVNQPPSPTQAIGTASIEGPPGSVLVVEAPSEAQPPLKWLRISRPNGPDVASFLCKLTKQSGNGAFVFSTALFIPENSNGVGTIQFESPNHPPDLPPAFMHIDFLPSNQVRIDDDQNTIFGNFTRNQVFLVQVTLNINSTSPNANIILSGAGASGSKDYAIIPPLRSQTPQFEQVRIWMGFPHTGSFLVNNALVTRKQ